MQPSKRIPGEPGIWVLISGELLIFSAFFITLALSRVDDLSAFRSSQAALNHTLGLINTLLLLTSSLLVALAVHRVRDRRSDAHRLFGAAMICGLGFIVIKLVEYGEKIASGTNFTTSDFFMFYFAFTGIHLMHVLVGMVVLAVLANVSRRPDAHNRMVLIECGAIFWHLVDLLWIVLFALFYVAR